MPLNIPPALVNEVAARMEPQQAASHPAVPEKTGMGKLGLLLMLAGQGADIGTTLAATSRGHEEKNPMGLGGTMAAKAGLMAGLPLMLKLLKVGRKPSNVIGGIAGAAGAIPAAMNLRTMGKS
jgi:hypothetical protein